MSGYVCAVGEKAVGGGGEAEGGPVREGFGMHQVCENCRRGVAWCGAVWCYNSYGTLLQKFTPSFFVFLFVHQHVVVLIPSDGFCGGREGPTGRLDAAECRTCTISTNRMHRPTPSCIIIIFTTITIIIIVPSCLPPLVSALLVPNRCKVEIVRRVSCRFRPMLDPTPSHLVMCLVMCLVVSRRVLFPHQWA